MMNIDRRIDRRTSEDALIYFVHYWGGDHCTLSLLAECMQLSRSRTCDLLTGLLLRGMIRRRVSGVSRRRYEYDLSQRGRAYFDENGQACLRAAEAIHLARQGRNVRYPD